MQAWYDCQDGINTFKHSIVLNSSTVPSWFEVYGAWVLRTTLVFWVVMLSSRLDFRHFEGTIPPSSSRVKESENREDKGDIIRPCIIL
jgi:hypothetical protein